MDKIIAILSLIFFACGDEPPDPNQKRVQLETSYSFSLEGGCPYEIVMVDSCEYIHVRNGNASWGTHKGNCKFCAERAKRIK